MRTPALISVVRRAPVAAHPVVAASIMRNPGEQKTARWRVKGA